MSSPTLVFVRRKSLDERRNAAARTFVQRLVDERYDGVVTRAAEAWGVSQATLAGFLNPKNRKGAGINVLDAIAEHEGVYLDEILGRPLPSGRRDPALEQLERQFPGRPNLIAIAQTAEWREATDEQRALVLDEVNRSGGDLPTEDYLAELKRARRLRPGERADVTRDVFGRTVGEVDDDVDGGRE
jgi:hypothetical protein